MNLNITTGIPLVYEFSDDLKTLNHYYLGDEEKIKKAAESVAAQGKAKASNYPFEPETWRSAD